MKEIPLSQSLVALVDDEDYERVAKYKWHVDYGKPRPGRSTAPYARGYVDGVHTRMHRFILSAAKGQLVDHKNPNATLDCRRSNLRFATSGQNSSNSRKRAGTSSRFKGVSWVKYCHRWRAVIAQYGRWIHLGTFRNEVDAAIAYNKAATKYFGEFALLNDIPLLEMPQAERLAA